VKFRDWFSRFLSTPHAETVDGSRAEIIARRDEQIFASGRRRFSHGTRPVIRWIKGDGLDDPVTRSAIAQATRLFGNKVDYCLCTNGIDAARVRSLLEWSTQPVEWWPVTRDDNPRLASILEAAGCTPEKFGYWWKWFPERVREHAPEWVLDGDMVITGSPTWFETWAQGKDVCRVSQDNRIQNNYGAYAEFVDKRKLFYSGLISLPPNVRYMNEVAAVLAAKPLAHGHDGRRDMCEQGVIAGAFQRVGAKPIPLYEFPFGRAFEDFIDYGLEGDRGVGWGYHFGNSFRRNNPHFDRLVSNGVIFSLGEAPSIVERFTWLGGFGQWGIPGWTMPDECARIVLEHAKRVPGASVLELGTSRGRLTSMLASVGCRVTTVDHRDRGAAQNLAGLDVEVVVSGAYEFLAGTDRTFDLIVVDFHGNSEDVWRRIEALLKQRLSRSGMLLLLNAVLWKIPEWKTETGVDWFLKNLQAPWRYEVYAEPLPGVAVVSNG